MASVSFHPATANHTRPGLKHVDVFQLDDLLVACAQDIIVNGMETGTIPDSIKEWVAGKVLKSLPKRLVQKLLSFILDNRDISEAIGLRENSTGDEFTMVVYKSAKQKQRMEEKEERDALIRANTGLDPNGNDPNNPKADPTPEKIEAEKNLFNAGRDLTEDGFSG